MWYCFIIELHAYDFVMKDFVIKMGALFVPGPVVWVLGGQEKKVWLQPCHQDLEGACGHGKHVGTT